MRAVVVRAPGGPEALVLAEVPRPRPGPDEVLVDVEAVGVNPVDAGNRADPSWAGLRAPYVVGYELAGHAVDSGEPVWALLPVRGTTRGALADRVAVPREYVAPRPPELHPIVAAALPLAGCTALQVLQRLPLPAGSWVFVHGATGGVGHLLVQLARSCGLHVAGAGRPEERRRLEELGVDLVVDRAEPAPVAAAARRLGAELDAVVDLVGGRLASSLPSVREGGQAATVVDLAGDLDLAIDRNIDVHGVLVRPGRDRLYELSAAVSSGLRPHVTDTYPLERAADAHRRLEAGRVGGKLVITL
ncbi:MAG TPA: NADP-dependent oxidoreductase [Nocardioides sp.]|jgi:NADPH:quinone reductase-like Zn-dependent oxidoreductase|uniref:quinone oxidoreductase family protein n=1 Tax=Nocardioides sp. TaxID=35761 RepID=UPI002E37E184|nr:NADP-dependent oxidoreductase [Nocardioides sp.]HEX3932668.1 NADP-dependent oxidoreductase [Nocardioides sp.]